MQIYPAILTDSMNTFREHLDKIQHFSDAVQTVHIDIIDGEFVDNLTITPTDLFQVDSEGLFFDFHLMVEHPDDYLEECFSAPNTRAIIAQIERVPKQDQFIEEVKKHEALSGLSLDIYTPVASIDEASWQELKVVQLMGIEVGFQGQEMKVELLTEKVRRVAEIKRERGLKDLEIIVDGGVDLQTLPQMRNIGIDSVVVGSGIWESDEPAESFKRLQEKV